MSIDRDDYPTSAERRREAEERADTNEATDRDTGTRDTGTRDTGTRDTGTRDTGTRDTGTRDTDDADEAETDATDKPATVAGTLPAMPAPGMPAPGMPVPAASPPATPVRAEATRTDSSPATPAAGTTVPDQRDVRSDWQRVQASFVDDPHASVEQAAGMVEEAAETVVATIQARERQLRGAWENGNTDTEKLRTTLRDYHELYDQLNRL